MILLILFKKGKDIGFCGRNAYSVGIGSFVGAVRLFKYILVYEHGEKEA